MKSKNPRLPSQSAPRGSRIGNRSKVQPAATSRATRCNLQFTFNCDEGMTAPDFKKLTKLFDFLTYSLRGMGELPGITGQFPKTKARGSHCHPARRFLDDFIYFGREFCFQRSKPEWLTFALGKETSR